MLTSIHIRGFKGFRDTKIPELRRVNLILGGQNSGKTSLLEAIRIGQTTYRDLKKISDLLDRDSFRTQPPTRSEKWLLTSNATEGLFFELLPTEGRSIKCFSTLPTDESELVKLYVTAVKNAHKGRWTNLLKQIEPRLIELDQFPPDNEVDSVVHANIGLHQLVPLSMLGQGFNRLAYLYAGLLGQNANIALIDEIENGIHYSALPILWQGIANMARELNIQIFATTHSYECIQAAAKVFEKTPEEFQLIRLDRTDDNNIAPVLIQGRKIQTALQSGWEVR